jgi:hypothetical protein
MTTLTAVREAFLEARGMWRMILERDGPWIGEEIPPDQVEAVRRKVYKGIKGPAPSEL